MGTGHVESVARAAAASDDAVGAITCQLMHNGCHGDGGHEDILAVQLLCRCWRRMALDEVPTGAVPALPLEASLATLQRSVQAAAGQGLPGERRLELFVAVVAQRFCNSYADAQ